MFLCLILLTACANKTESIGSDTKTNVSEEVTNNVSEDITTKVSEDISPVPVADIVEKESASMQPEVTLDEMKFTVNNKTFDITEVEPMANAIMSVSYINDDVFVLECHINPNVGYYALFDTKTMTYYNGFYGTNLTWLDGNLDSVIYVDGNTINSLNETVLFTTELTENQFIYDLRKPFPSNPDLLILRRRRCFYRSIWFFHHHMSIHNLYKQ
jgi:hypothetical protein